MNCADVQTHLVELVYDEMPAEQQPDVRNHLASCDTCRAVWHDIEMAHQSMSQLSQPENPSPVDVVGVYQSVAIRSKQSHKRWRAGTFVAGLLAIAMLFLVIVRVSIDLEKGQIVISWNDPAKIKPTLPTTTDPWPRLDENSDRISAVEELVQLTAHEVLTEDSKLQEIVALRQQIASWQLRMARQLDDLQARDNLRWKLIAEELALRDSLDANFALTRLKP